MVFCNSVQQAVLKNDKTVTILILIDGFLQYRIESNFNELIDVTILILIDGFLQFVNEEDFKSAIKSHNPYFNRWFSAIGFGNSV